MKKVISCIAIACFLLPLSGTGANFFIKNNTNNRLSVLLETTDGKQYIRLLRRRGDQSDVIRGDLDEHIYNVWIKVRSKEPKDETDEFTIWYVYQHEAYDFPRVEEAADARVYYTLSINEGSTYHKHPRNKMTKQEHYKHMRNKLALALVFEAYQLTPLSKQLIHQKGQLKSPGQKYRGMYKKKILKY
jgi:hypothetical protein